MSDFFTTDSGRNGLPWKRDCPAFPISRASLAQTDVCGTPLNFARLSAYRAIFNKSSSDPFFTRFRPQLSCNLQAPAAVGRTKVSDLFTPIPTH